MHTMQQQVPLQTQQRQVIFVAYGTRGDVQPVACLACHLQHSEPTAAVTFITHAAHNVWLAKAFSSIQFTGIDTLPACPAPSVQPSSSDEAFRQYQEFRGFEQHMKTLQAIDGIISTNGDVFSDHSNRQCTEPAHSSSHVGNMPVPGLHEGPAEILFVFNLFALEVYSIAEALQAHAVAVHPYVIPYRAPAGFARAFRRSMPQLYDALNRPQDDVQAEQQHSNSSNAWQAAAERVQDAAADTLPHARQRVTWDAAAETARSHARHRVTWAEVQHWMWPLFSPRWHALRQHLKLAPWPLHEPPKPGGVLNTCTPCTVQQPLPHAVPLLYGFSPSYIVPPNFWPPSVQACGSWTPNSCCQNTEELPTQLLQLMCTFQQQLSQEGAADSTSSPGHVCAAAVPLGCVDMGSTAALMGLVPDAGRWAWILASALKRCDRYAILLTAGWQQLHTACLQLEATLRARLLLCDYPVSHQALCPHISFLLHPAGSGTTAAGLMGGVPHVLLPLHFDQFSHAERLHDLGLAAAPLPTSLLAITATTAAEMSAGASSEPQPSLDASQFAQDRDGRLSENAVHRKRQRIESGVYVGRQYEFDKGCQESTAMLAAAIQQATSIDMAETAKHFQVQLQQEECGLDVGLRLLRDLLNLAA